MHFKFVKNSNEQGEIAALIYVLFESRNNFFIFHIKSIFI